MQTLAEITERVTYRREVERWPDGIAVEARLAARIPFDDLDALFDARRGQFNIQNYGWDLRRQYGDDGFCHFAFELLEDAPAELVDLPFDEQQRRIADAWQSFDRPRLPTDRLIVDLAARARADGWQPSAETVVMLDRLTDIAEAKRAEEIAAGLAAERVENDALDAEWKALDLAAHAKVQAAGNVVSFDEFRKSREYDTVRGLDTTSPHDHAMRGYNKAVRERDRAAAESARLIETFAKQPPKPDYARAAINEASRARIAAEQELNIAAQVARAVWQREMNELVQAVDTRAAELQARVDAAPATLPLPGNSAQALAMFNRTDLDWVDVDRFSTPVPMCSDNIPVFLRRVDVSLRWNAWLDRVEINKAGDAWTAYTDRHFDELMTTAANDHYRFRPAEGFFRRAISTIAHANEVDPAIDHLAELERSWDGTRRLSAWLTEACGVPADAYHSAVGAAIIGGMVRRIRHPGCKFDLMAVFVGDQGAGKSTLAKIIALDPEWFSESVSLGIETKELLQLLRGKAVVEISEMRSRGDVDSVKAMLSRTVDAARVAYGREPIERPRRNIFVGTTNAPEMLDDTTGNRRFLPVTVTGEIRLDWLRENIAQIVGEAATLESQGATFNLPRAVWGDAAARQDAARAQSDYEVILAELFPAERGALWISAADLQIRVRNAVVRSVPPKQIAGAMRALGFVNASQRIYGATAKVWRRGNVDEAQRIGQFPATLPLPNN
jgi:hypothetical protein